MPIGHRSVTRSVTIVAFLCATLAVLTACATSPEEGTGIVSAASPSEATAPAPAADASSSPSTVIDNGGDTEARLYCLRQ